MRLLYFFLTFSVLQNAWAGAFTPKPGNAYAKAAVRVLAGELAAGDSGTQTLPDAYVDVGLRLFGEVGVSPRIAMMVFGTPIGGTYIGSESRTYVGELGGGLHFGLLQSDLKIALEVSLSGTPAQDETPLLSTGDLRWIPVVGSSRFLPALHVGGSLPFGLWLQGNVGYAISLNERLLPAVTGFLQLGWQINKLFTVEAHLNIYMPTQDLVSPFNVAGTSDTRYVGLGLSGTYWFIEDVGLHLGVEGAAYFQANAGAPSLTIGLEWRRALDT